MLRIIQANYLALNLNVRAVCAVFSLARFMQLAILGNVLCSEPWYLIA